MTNAQGEKLVAIGCAMFFIAPPVIMGLAGMGQGLYWLLAGTPEGESAAESFSVGATFAALGVGFAVCVAFRFRDAVAQRHRRAEFPDAPWRWRTDWAAGVIRVKKPIEMIACWIATPLYGVAGLVVCTVYWDLLYGSRFAPALLLYPLVGIALLGRTLYTTLRWRKYGATTCELMSNPAVPGGEFQANIRTRLYLANEQTAVATLTCYHRYTYNGPNEKRRVRRDVVWQESEFISRERIAAEPYDTVLIPIEIPIPDSCPPTTPGSPSDRIEWELSVQAAVSGVNFAADFIVPVF